MQINRRQCLQQISTVASGALLTSGLSQPGDSLAAEPGKNPPNVVLIISDDQAWGDYGFMGHSAIETPHLDKLASESVVFTRGYVAAPLCCPSLASILTGLHPHQHKVTSNDPPYSGTGNRYNIREWSSERLQQRNEMIAHIDEMPTLPKQLKEKNYLSQQTGKWWLGNYKRGGFTHGMTHGDTQNGGRHGDEGLSIGRDSMQPIYDFIAESGEHPFFLWYAPFLPHTPHNPPERFLEKYRDKTDSLPIAKYWAMCEWFDETCGELLNHLEEQGIANNTIVLYVCDNGWIQQPDQNGYAERSKRSPYEGGIRTPIMVKFPGQTTPKFDETTLVSAVDLAPTILKACGLEPTEDMQGVNLLDESALQSRKAVFGAAYTHDAVDIHNPVSSLKYAYALEGNWKLIQPSGRNDTGTEPELYNVINDPDELENLAETHPEKVKHMQELLDDWWDGAVVMTG